jgi:hypothetical protein
MTSWRNIQFKIALLRFENHHGRSKYCRSGANTDIKTIPQLRGINNKAPATVPEGKSKACILSLNCQNLVLMPCTWFRN